MFTGKVINYYRNKTITPNYSCMQIKSDVSAVVSIVRGNVEKSLLRAAVLSDLSRQTVIEYSFDKH